MRKIKLPVCVVNQIRMEALCKSVDDCAKFSGARLAFLPPERFWAPPPSTINACSPGIVPDPSVLRFPVMVKRRERAPGFDSRVATAEYTRRFDRQSI